jgi:hypothetical protein
MEGQGIVDLGSDSGCGEVLPEIVASRGADDELVVDVMVLEFAARPRLGGKAEHFVQPAGGEFLTVECGA